MLNFDPLGFLKRSMSYGSNKNETHDIKTNDTNSTEIKDDENSALSINKNEFPYTLGPFGICKCDLLETHFSFIICHENETGFYQIDPRQFKYDKTINFSVLLEFINYINTSKDMNVYSYGILGNISPLYMVTLNTESKKYANIPINAQYFSWSYPSILPKNILSNIKDKQITEKWLSHPNIILLTVGGYMYFDKNKKLLQINTLIPAIDGGLQFSKPKKWDNRFTMTLHKNGRFQEITIASLSEKGAKYFCWLFPMEEIENEKFEKRVFTKHGGFAYLFHEPGDLTDDNLVKMDRYFEVLDGNEFNASNKKRQLLLKKGIIKDIDDKHKHWKLTYIEYKKKELETLKNELQELYAKNNDDDDDDDDKEEEKKDENMVKNWNNDKVSNWLKDINMNELRFSFFKHGINGEKLMENAYKNNTDCYFGDIIRNLSKSELESIVINQLNDDLVTLKQQNDIENDKNNKEVILRNKIKELQIEIESIQDCKICLICYENDKNMLIKPCNHVCCCNICINHIKNCPLCDKQIHSTERIYN